mmetsp:Transcript_54235/g.115756  ORF Transcript_54235/g.115756 Transcript_54235/m.115756 type:complete len:249 (-) Transcript_54235:187-933(-)
MAAALLAKPLTRALRVGCSVTSAPLFRAAACARRSAVFDSLANEYDNQEKVDRAADVAKAVRARPWYKPGGGLLDVGAGTGLLTFQLASDFQKVAAFDVSTGMLDVLNGKAEKSGLTVQTATDMKELGKFDLIVSLLAFHHIPKPEEALHNLVKSHVNPGGRVAVIDLVANDNVRRFHKPEEKIPDHYEYDGFSKETVEAWYSACGCTDFDWSELPLRKQLHAGWPRVEPGVEDEEHMFFIASAACPK